MLYESHITCSIHDAKAAQTVADQFRWKTSQIARDITLGDDTYFYLTTHDVTEERIRQRMVDTAFALTQSDINVIRMKIEHIIFDTKHKA